MLRAYEFLAAVVVSLLARTLDALWPLCFDAVTLSALIYLLQGWTMTNASAPKALNLSPPRPCTPWPPPQTWHNPNQRRQRADAASGCPPDARPR